MYPEPDLTGPRQHYAHDVRVFLTGALCIPRFDAHVICEVVLSHKDQVAHKLMYLEANRVKITDSPHVCPFCAHGCIDNLFIMITLVVRNVTRGSDQVPLLYMHLGKFISLHSETLK